LNVVAHQAHAPAVNHHQRPPRRAFAAPKFGIKCTVPNKFSLMIRIIIQMSSTTPTKSAVTEVTSGSESENEFTEGLNESTAAPVREPSTLKKGMQPVVIAATGPAPKPDIVREHFKNLAIQKAKEKAEKQRAPSPKRNSKHFSLEQSIALLTEVVEGETYLMVKSKTKKYEERTLVKRSQGIPHGKNPAYWDAIIEKLESDHWTQHVGDKRVPLFPLSLKRDYVSGHFDKLVNQRMQKLERRKQSQGARNSGGNGHNDDDFVTGEGDESGSEKELEKKSDAKENKAMQSQIDELLDAYLLQQTAFNASVDCEAASVFNTNAESAKAGTKRPSGQPNESSDLDLIEDSANGKKQSKLPKLPMPSHAERAQSQSLDRASAMSGGFQALADSQRPSSVEDFTKKSSAVIEMIGKTVAETASQAIDSWSKYKMSQRACVTVDGVHEWQTLREKPLRMICKRCGNLITC
jgi:hypothetical protein